MLQVYKRNVHFVSVMVPCHSSTCCCAPRLMSVMHKYMDCHAVCSDNTTKLWQSLCRHKSDSVTERKKSHNTHSCQHIMCSTLHVGMSCEVKHKQWLPGYETRPQFTMFGIMKCLSLDVLHIHKHSVTCCCSLFLGQYSCSSYMVCSGHPLLMMIFKSC